MSAQYQSSDTGCRVGGVTGDDLLDGGAPCPDRPMAASAARWHSGRRWLARLVTALVTRGEDAPPDAAQRVPARPRLLGRRPRRSAWRDAIPVILLVYANDRTQDGRYLRNLPEERRANSATLREAEDANLIELVECTNATLGDVIDACQRNRRRIIAIHLAGHADGDSLVFEHADGSPTAAAASSFAEFLGELPALELVFLNSCATRGQLGALLDHGVPAVIVTSTLVRDEVAQVFAYYFYSEAGRGETIDDAFRHASVDTKFAFSAGRTPTSAGLWRDINVHELPSEPFPWELHGNAAAIQQQLVPIVQSAEPDAMARASWRSSDTWRLNRIVLAQVIAGCLIALAIAAALIVAVAELLSVVRAAGARQVPNPVGQRHDRPPFVTQSTTTAVGSATVPSHDQDHRSAISPRGDLRPGDARRDQSEARPPTTPHVRSPEAPARRTPRITSRPAAAEVTPPKPPIELDREMIQRQVRSHRDEFKRCYESQLVEQPSLGGTVNTRFVINPAGSVTALTASGVDSTVSACVAETIQHIQFPASNGSTQVSYPFHFVRRQDVAAQDNPHLD